MLLLSTATNGHAPCVHSIDWSCTLCPQHRLVVLLVSTALIGHVPCVHTIDWSCSLCPQHWLVMFLVSTSLIGQVPSVHSIDWSCCLCPQHWLVTLFVSPALIGHAPFVHSIDWSCCLCPQSGETPVHVAVRFCHLQVMKTLLNYVSKNKSHMDAVMLVNQASYVSSCVLLYLVSCSNVFLFLPQWIHICQLLVFHPCFRLSLVIWWIIIPLFCPDMNIALDWVLQK